jgi:hypothetical protein
MLWKKFIGALGAMSLAAAGAFALASPAQAVTTNEAVSTCEGLTFTVTPNADHRAWRAVIDKKVVWQSGDWEDQNLGDDHQKLVDAGWTKKGPFEVHVPARHAKRGPVTMEWWDTYEPDWMSLDGSEWEWKKPDDCRERIEPKKPEHRDATCDEKGFIDIPDQKGVQYRIDGKRVDPGKHEVKPGKYEVTAEPKRHHRFKDDVKKRWLIKIEEPKDCPDDGRGGEKDDKKKDEDDKLPVTGASTGVAAGGALALLALGGTLLFLARQRRLRFTA